MGPARQRKGTKRHSQQIIQRQIISKGVIQEPTVDLAANPLHAASGRPTVCVTMRDKRRDRGGGLYSTYC